MSPPDLPVAVLVTVAEFLAGDHAFGTLAALNQASRTVKQGTLAVLYETLFLDKRPGLVQASSEGLFHTKFCFCQDRHEQISRANMSCPNTVAIIEIVRVTDEGDNAGVVRCDVHFLRPVKTATIFGVITQTPVYCHFREGSTDHAPDTDGQGSAIPRNEAHDSQASSDLRPTLCKLQELRNVGREDGGTRGGSFPDQVTNSWTTDIRLGDTTYTGTFRDEFNECDGHTVCELLRMTGRERIRDRHVLKSDSSHLITYAWEKGCDALVQRIEREVATHPEVLLNKIVILVFPARNGNTANCADVVQKTIADLGEVCQRAISQSRQRGLGVDALATRCQTL